MCEKSQRTLQDPIIFTGCLIMVFKNHNFISGDLMICPEKILDILQEILRYPTTSYPSHVHEGVLLVVSARETFVLRTPLT